MTTRGVAKVVDSKVALYRRRLKTLPLIFSGEKLTKKLIYKSFYLVCYRVLQVFEVKVIESLVIPKVFCASRCVPHLPKICYISNPPLSV